MENPLRIKQIQACVASVVQEHRAMAGKRNHGRRLMIQSVCFKEKGRPSTPAPTISMTEHLQSLWFIEKWFVFSGWHWRS